MINLVDKLRELDIQLIELLQNIKSEDWGKQTVAKLWTVKDVAAHLLDGNIRVLSSLRDKHKGEKREINTYDELLNYLNGLNAEWVLAMKRVSSKVLVELLKETGNHFYKYYASLNLNGKAEYSVAWAGENKSKNWMHIAREYTEKFLHQQQIRDAVNMQGILTKEYFYPFLDVCMYALPYTLRNTSTETGNIIEMKITGESGGTWYAKFNGKSWERIDSEISIPPITTIEIDANSSWKLFSKSLRPIDLKENITIKGNKELGKVAIEMVSFMV